MKWFVMADTSSRFTNFYLQMVKFRAILYNDAANMMLLLQSSHGIRIKDLIPECPELMNVLKDRYDAVYSVVKV